MFGLHALVVTVSAEFRRNSAITTDWTWQRYGMMWYGMAWPRRTGQGMAGQDGT